MHVGGQSAGDVGEFGVNAFGELDGADGRLFCDGNQHGGVRLDRSQAQSRQGAGHDDLGHVAHRHDAGGVGADDGAFKFGGGGGVDFTFYNILVAEVIEETTGGIVVDALGGGNQLGERHAVGFHLLGREPYLELAGIAALDADLRHAANGKQTGAHHAVGNSAQVEHCGGVGCQSDNHHLAEYRRLRTHLGGVYAGGEFLANESQALGDGLAGDVYVRVPVKLDIHHRKAGGG